MATDRFVDWEGFDKPPPTREQLRMMLEDYFGEKARIAWWHDRFLCDLPGISASNALERWPGIVKHFQGGGRLIEVWLREREVDVITRGQDQFTCAVADGLVKLLVTFCGGMARE